MLSVMAAFLTSSELTLLTTRHDGCSQGQQMGVRANGQVIWTPWLRRSPWKQRWAEQTSRLPVQRLASEAEVGALCGRRGAPRDQWAVPQAPPSGSCSRVFPQGPPCDTDVLLLASASSINNFLGDATSRAGIVFCFLLFLFFIPVEVSKYVAS